MQVTYTSANFLKKANLASRLRQQSLLMQSNYSNVMIHQSARSLTGNVYNTVVCKIRVYRLTLCSNVEMHDSETVYIYV